ncbi:hypothetical protein ABIA35_005399 [Catenulispora sp. MAP12-49]|uniref:glycoside hydrolase family 113 n=1 Tax=Catenulispora sp. MAP12-49 TaxID=3156302 RepID=UPI0035123910
MRAPIRIPATASRAVAATVAAAVLLVTAGCAQMAPGLPDGTDAIVAAPQSGDPAHPQLTPQPQAVGIGPEEGAGSVPSPVGPPSQVPTPVRNIPADLGINLYWHTIGSNAVVDATAGRLLNYVVGLGANSVAIAFPIFTDGVHPTRVYGTSGITPSPAQLGRIIAAAKARGLRVMVRPLLDEANLLPSGAWRGSIAPPNVDGWFASYRAFLDPYFAVAKAQDAEEFVVGTELDAFINSATQWRQVVADGQARFGGLITYASTWNTWDHAQVPSAVPGVGVDAYPPVHLPDSATVDQLSAAWTAWLKNRPASVLAQTAIQELGIPAQAGVYANPGAWGGATAAIEPQVQVNWFTAACDSARALHMRGLYFWMLDSNANTANAASYPSGSFIGRGDSAIKTCFSQGWSHS